jgi:hypothetical protein
MHPLCAPDLLRVWEEGQPRSLLDRALLLLSYACPEDGPDELAALPIGHRDDRLLTLREWAMGPTLQCLETCPGCGERLELSFRVDDVRAPCAPATDVLSVDHDGYHVEFRLPTSADLASITTIGDPAAAERELLGRCLLSVRSGDRQHRHRLPADVRAAVVAKMAEADPQADVHTELSCPACEATWPVAFDIVSFFWAEIDVWARQTLHSVHRLASAYGWSEADVLALSPRRRQYYLEMVG